MSQTPNKRPKRFTGYFWLMLFLYMMLALGLTLLLMGLGNPKPSDEKTLAAFHSRLCVAAAPAGLFAC